MATIALQRVANPLEFGVVVTGEDGRITRFLEKPSWGEIFSDTINTGIYVLEPEVFEYMETGKNYDFSRDIFPLMLRDGRALYAGMSCGGYWSDIGNLQQYMQANYDALRRAVKLEIPGVEVRPGVWVGDGASHLAGRARARAGLHRPQRYDRGGRRYRGTDARSALLQSSRQTRGFCGRLRGRMLTSARRRR